MILGCKTKEEAKIESNIESEIKANPKLGKVKSILGLISGFQQASPDLTVMSMDSIVPADVVQFISQGVWKYDFTTTPSPAPPNMPYTATWVKITSVTWS